MGEPPTAPFVLLVPLRIVLLIFSRGASDTLLAIIKYVELAGELSSKAVQVHVVSPAVITLADGRRMVCGFIDDDNITYAL